jgi:hypothetical protein
MIHGKQRASSAFGASRNIEAKPVIAASRSSAIKLIFNDEGTMRPYSNVSHHLLLPAVPAQKCLSLRCAEKKRLW